MMLQFQYNKQHVIPLEDIKLQSLDDEGSKCSNFFGPVF